MRIIVCALLSLAWAINLDCYACISAVNEVEGLLSENATDLAIEHFLSNTLCKSSPAVCKAILAFGIPLFVAALDEWGSPGTICVDLSLCEKADKDRPDHLTVSSFRLDLDLAPEFRWNGLFGNQKLLDAVDKLYEMVKEAVGVEGMKALMYAGREVFAALSEEYRAELRSLSKDIGLPLELVSLFQIAYDFFDCTSIVANQPGGDVLHIRNLDFGIGMEVSDILRDLVIEMDVVRGETLLFRTQTMAGFLGILTAVKPHAFSMSINTRFEKRNLILAWKDIIEEILTHPEAIMPPHLARETMVNATSFDQAVTMLSMPAVIGSVYYTVGGTKAGQGSIIARSQNAVVRQINIGEMFPDWFTLQTNYDWFHGRLSNDTTTPNPNIPWFDNRRQAGIDIMQKVGQSRLDAHTGIYTVLSTKPVLNRQTVASVAMKASDGSIVVESRYCNDPCPI